MKACICASSKLLSYWNAKRMNDNIKNLFHNRSGVFSLRLLLAVALSGYSISSFFGKILPIRNDPRRAADGKKVLKLPFTDGAAINI